MCTAARVRGKKKQEGGIYPVFLLNQDQHEMHTKEILEKIYRILQKQYKFFFITINGAKC